MLHWQGILTGFDMTVVCEIQRLQAATQLASIQASRIQDSSNNIVVRLTKASPLCFMYCTVSCLDSRFSDTSLMMQHLLCPV